MLYLCIFYAGAQGSGVAVAVGSTAIVAGGGRIVLLWSCGLIAIIENEILGNISN